MKNAIKYLAILIMSIFSMNAFASEQCTGKTKAGAQCKRMTNAKTHLCWQHDPAHPKHSKSADSTKKITK